MKRIKKLAMLLSVVLSLNINTFVAKADSTSVSQLVEKAVSQKSFYYYNQAYAQIVVLEDGKIKDALLNRLSSVSSQIWNNDVKLINSDLDSLSKTGSAKLYDEVQIKINNSKLPEIDKAYFLAEVNSWGVNLVWTEDYKSAMKALLGAGIQRTSKSVQNAKQEINKVKNIENRGYLMDTLNSYNIVETSTIENNSNQTISLNETYDKNKVGNIKGVINYQNKNGELLPDVAASIAFIPMTSLKYIDDKDYINQFCQSLVPTTKVGIQILGKYGIYSDYILKDEYNFKDVPAGKYYVVVRSFNSTQSLWSWELDENDMAILDAIFNSKDIGNMKLMLQQYKYVITTVEIKENETTTFNYNFMYEE
jgi:hypothetical protein